MSSKLTSLASAANALNPFSESSYYTDIVGDIEKAELKILDVGASLYVQFNPNKLTITRGTANWGSPKTGASNLPTKQYTGHAADTLSCDLLFDASEEDTEGGLLSFGSDTPGGGSIMDLVTSFHALTLPYDFGATKGGIRPPVIQFKWGTDGIDFAGVMKDCSYDITMFNKKGLPMRATVKISISGEFLPKSTDVNDILAAAFKAPAPGDAKKAADAFAKVLDSIQK